MTNDSAQKFRTVAARWRAVLGDVLAPAPLLLDQKRHTALQHGAQVKENVVVVLSQLQEIIKGTTPAQLVHPLCGLLTDSAIASTAEVNSLSYQIADTLGQVADSVERLAASTQPVDAKVAQLVNALLEDSQDRAGLVEQSYEAYRQQQAQQQ